MPQPPHSTPELFGSATVGPYAAAMTETVALLASRARRVDRPRSAATPAQLRSLVDAVDLDAPLDGLEAALAEVGELYVDHAVWFHDPGYLAHVNCPVAIPALAADLLASAVNTSVDTWDQSTTGTLVEQRVIDWTATRIGYGPAADGVFTSGGTQSNLHALLLARQEAAAAGPHRPGLILATAQSHFSVHKAGRLLGLPDDGVVEVATDARYRMDPAALARTLATLHRRGGTPIAVVATAGTTDLGRIDPLPELAQICAAYGVWFHVDAAYGCGLLVSPTRRHLLAGIEQADSVTVDFHKSFFQPVSCSALLVRDGSTLRHGTTHADYLSPRGSVLPNLVDKSLQTTRRLDALKLWLTLRTMGPQRIGELFDVLLDTAAEVHAWMLEQPDLQVATDPTLSTVLFRWRPPGTGDAEAGRLAPVIRWAMFHAGEALVASTTLDGTGWLKISLLNPATRLADVRRAVEVVRRTGTELLARQAVAGLDAELQEADRREAELVRVR